MSRRTVARHVPSSSFAMLLLAVLAALPASSTAFVRGRCGDAANAPRLKLPNGTLTMKVNTGNVPAGVTGAQMQAAATAAAATWTNDPGSALTVTISGTTTAHACTTKGSACDPLYNNTIEFTDCPLPNGHIAYTYFLCDDKTGAIAGVSICINKGSNWSTAPAGGQNDLESHILHELGHAIGLDHTDQNDPSIVMSEGLQQGLVRRVLSNDDRAGIGCIYPANPAPRDYTALTQPPECPGEASWDVNSPHEGDSPFSSALQPVPGVPAGLTWVPVLLLAAAGALAIRRAGKRTV